MHEQKELVDIVSQVNGKLKVNPWVILFLFILVSSLTGLIHGGFGEWQQIIYKVGAFSYLCNGENETIFEVNKNITYKSCSMRDATINDLSTFSYMAEFLTFPINGYILDKTGARTCYLYGQIVILLAFLLLSIFGNYSYIWHVFFILTGLSTDAAYLPLLKIVEHFPGRESLVFGILGSARSTCYGLPYLLKILFFYGLSLTEKQFYVLCIGYICIASLYSILVGLLFIPLKKKTVHNTDITVEQPTVNNDPANEKLEPEKKEFDNRGILRKINHKLHDFKNTINRLWEHPQKWEYLIVVFICCMSILRYDFYAKTNREFFAYDGHNIVYVYSTAIVVAFIPAPFFGYLIDKRGPVFVLIINNILLSLSYLFLFFIHIFFRYLSIFCYFFYVSFCFSIYHCYIDKRYPKEHFGKLSGFMFVATSILLLLNFYLTHLTNNVYNYLGNKKHFPVVTGMTIIGVIVLFLCFYLEKTNKSISNK